MKEKFIECRAIGKDVIKSWHCPSIPDCKDCPDLRKENPAPKKASKNPILDHVEYAEAYIAGNIQLPILDEITAALNDCSKPVKTQEEKEAKKRISKRLRDKVSALIQENELKTIKGLNLATEVEEKIVLALYEFGRAILLSQGGNLKKANQFFLKLRSERIEGYEKVLALPNPSDIAEPMRNELSKLRDWKRTHDKKKPVPYRAQMEAEFNKTLLEEPPYLMMVTGNEKLHALMKRKKAEEMFDQPMEIKGGRPSKFFFNALQCVIFRYLREVGLPIGMAEDSTAKIINEYASKKKLPGVSPLNKNEVRKTHHGA